MMAGASSSIALASTGAGESLFLVDGVHEAVSAYGDRIGLLLAILAAVTMTLGNLSALRQSLPED